MAVTCQRAMDEHLQCAAEIQHFAGAARRTRHGLRELDGDKLDQIKRDGRLARAGAATPIRSRLRTRPTAASLAIACLRLDMKNCIVSIFQDTFFLDILPAVG